MKTYEEMVKYIVDNTTIGNRSFKYVSWAPIMTISVAYDIEVDKVSKDVQAGIAKFEAEEKLRRKNKVNSKMSNVDWLT